MLQFIAEYVIGNGELNKMSMFVEPVVENLFAKFF